MANVLNVDQVGAFIGTLPSKIKSFNKPKFLSDTALIVAMTNPIPDRLLYSEFSPLNSLDVTMIKNDDRLAFYCSICKSIFDRDNISSTTISDTGNIYIGYSQNPAAPYNWPTITINGIEMKIQPSANPVQNNQATIFPSFHTPPFVFMLNFDLFAVLCEISRSNPTCFITFLGNTSKDHAKFYITSQASPIRNEAYKNIENNPGQSFNKVKIDRPLYKSIILYSVSRKKLFLELVPYFAKCLSTTFDNNIAMTCNIFVIQFNGQDIFVCNLVFFNKNTNIIFPDCIVKIEPHLGMVVINDYKKFYFYENNIKNFLSTLYIDPDTIVNEAFRLTNIDDYSSLDPGLARHLQNMNTLYSRNIVPFQDRPVESIWLKYYSGNDADRRDIFDLFANNLFSCDTNTSCSETKFSLFKFLFSIYIRKPETFESLIQNYFYLKQALFGETSRISYMTSGIAPKSLILSGPPLLNIVSNLVETATHSGTVNVPHWLDYDFKHFGTPSLTTQAQLGEVTLSTIKNTNIQVVVKINVSSDEEEMFIREADIGIRLGHATRSIPSFAKTMGALDCNVYQDPISKSFDFRQMCVATGMPANYIFMELVKGTSFSKFVEDRSTSQHRILCALGQLFLGLEYAKRKVGFTHYDLHLQNIIYSDFPKPSGLPTFKKYTFKIDGNEYSIPAYGNITIIDFGRAYMNGATPVTIEPFHREYGIKLNSTKQSVEIFVVTMCLLMELVRSRRDLLVPPNDGLLKFIRFILGKYWEMYKPVAGGNRMNVMIDEFIRTRRVEVFTLNRRDGINREDPHTLEYGLDINFTPLDCYKTIMQLLNPPEYPPNVERCYWGDYDVTQLSCRDLYQEDKYQIVVEAIQKNIYTFIERLLYELGDNNPEVIDIAWASRIVNGDPFKNAKILVKELLKELSRLNISDDVLLVASS